MTVNYTGGRKDCKLDIGHLTDRRNEISGTRGEQKTHDHV